MLELPTATLYPHGVTVHDDSTEACTLCGTHDLPPARLRVIGYWIDTDRPDLPDPEKFIDADWDLTERQAVANYLNAGRPIGAGCGCSSCRICGTPNGFEEFTDGTFQWPEGLAHYVLEHAVRLPEEVVQHALRSSGKASDVGVVDTTWWVAATSLIRD